LNDCYTRVRMRSLIVFLQQLCLVIGAAFLLQASLAYGSLDVRMPRQGMLLGSSLCLILLPLWRAAYTKVALEVMGAERVLLVGTHPLQLELAGHLSEHREVGMQPVGFVAESAGKAAQMPGRVVLGTLVQLPALTREVAFDRMVVGLEGELPPEAIEEIIRVKQQGRRVEQISETFEAVFSRVALSQLKPEQVVLARGLQGSSLMWKVQAAYSRVIAFVGLVVLCPVLLATALAVRLSSAGPVLFRQVRAGRHNVPFLLFKFRSMHHDAEAGTGAVWAQENDPRVTRVGRLLRKYRLDELPQLFNVLRGEMSIVGPRPERPEFVELLAEEIPFYRHRLSVKPGITGWAQINYRYGNTVEDTIVKLEYDLYYIKNVSPQLDFFIMFHTLKTMLLTRGAY